MKPEPCRTIRVYFIKPSRYDEDGFVQYFRYGVQPNNTLTVMTALNEAFNKRYAVERNVRLETVIWDEICDGIVSPETIKAIKEKAREDGVELLIGLAGVQSNQYPRGRDLALQFVAEGLPTMMGGFHVSGFPDSCKFLNECGVTTVVGEAENIWGDIVEDFLRGELRKQLFGHAGNSREDRPGRHHRSADHRVAAAGARRSLPHAIFQRHDDHARHFARMPVHLLVLQREERDGPHDALARARRGRELGARRMPASWHRVAVPGR